MSATVCSVLAKALFAQENPADPKNVDYSCKIQLNLREGNDSKIIP